MDPAKAPLEVPTMRPSATPLSCRASMTPAWRAKARKPEERMRSGGGGADSGGGDSRAPARRSESSARRSSMV
eukprot:CAMPEP_0173248942 /NCGR_PEP_ID=MMETSP1142-20121109/18743_1 /TAXON_ID=483371 /ORGANISM="non described non described, Strain CCMP2298" /LENGTH=72 /DNA_ID=CAMNT_0014181513 /DNA_START=471 /DNA_END=689 /DNA_ORIENTATION=-